MKISVLIPTLNEAEVLEATLRSVRSAGAEEIVVADGGSTDATVGIARRAGCTVLAAPRGRARQQNAAAAVAQGEVLLFLHADARLAEDALQQVRTALSDPAILGGAFRQRIEAEGRLYRLLEQGNAWRAERGGLPYGDQGIFLRRSVFQRLGGFPEVPLLEDVILMRQFRQLQKPVLLEGPLYVNARRWQRHGIVGQTLRNWLLLTAYRCGVSPRQLARFYLRHDLDRSKPRQKAI